MAAQVRKALRALLPTIDLETTTERRIRQMIADDLGAAVVDKHKKVLARVLRSAALGDGGLGSSQPTTRPPPTYSRSSRT